MMLLSRFWYVILAVALSATVSLSYVSIHQHNRLREADTRTIIDHDRDIVDWYLRIDARRRIDSLAIVGLDDAVRNGLSKANAQDKLGADVREPLKRRLGELAQKLSTILRDEGRGGASPIMLFAVDNRGRVVGQANFDRASMTKEETFELGGFPIVVDALHGWLRDDTWALDRDSIYRVVARPVISAEGAPPAGAVVAMRRVDDGFARIVAERTNAPVMFYVAGREEGGATHVVGHASPDKSDVSFEGISPDAASLGADKDYNEVGASAPRRAGPLTVAYTRLIGSSWEHGAGFAVARKATPIADPLAALSSADESDKQAIPWSLVSGIALAAVLIGILASWLEHSLPTNRLLREARRFAKGEQDALPLAKLSGPYRSVGHAVNDGIERVLAKGGAASRRAADLERILGPVPTAPPMSAFSFGFDKGADSAKGVDDLFPNLPPPTPEAAKSGAQAAAPPARAPALAGAMTVPFGSDAPAAQARPQGSLKLDLTPPPGPPPSVKNAAVPGPAQSSAPPSFEEDNEETMVARVPEELRQASATGETRAIESAEEIVQWRQVFDDFIAMRAKCGEPTNGLSFEKFQAQLRKNRDALQKQYNCKRVRFAVYEKEGKASLKATPLRD